MKAVKLTTLAVVALASSVATADDYYMQETNPVAISAEIGTLGYGASIGWSVNDSTELQAGWTGTAQESTALNASTNSGFVKTIVDKVGVQIPVSAATTVTTKQNNPFVGVQLRPFSNWLTVGAGVMVPNTEWNVRATHAVKSGEETPELFKDLQSGYAYQSSDISVTYKNSNKLAPYGTIGLRPNLNNNWGIFAEVGAAYMGEPKQLGLNVAVRAADIKGQQLPPTAVNELRDKVDNALNSDTAKTLEKYNGIYPIAKVGATYRF